MSEPNNPTTMQELVRHLADTLVTQEVLGPMDAIGWREGQPPPARLDNPTPGGAPPTESTPAAAAPAGTTPTPAPAVATPVKADAPATDLPSMFESLRDPATGKILGKYDTIDQAVKGVGHAVQMAKQSFNERDAAKQEVARLAAELEKARQTQSVAAPAAVQSQRLTDPQSRAAVDKAQASYDEVLRKVVEEGGLLDEEAAKALSVASRELARAEARLATEESFATRDSARSEEQAKWDRVNERMKADYPESEQFADEMGLYVQSQPLLAEAIAARVARGQELEASILAWNEFKKAQDAGLTNASLAAAKTEEVKMEAADQVRKEAVEQARKDAGIPGTSAGGVHARPDAAPSQTEIEAAAEAMRAYGAQPGNPGATRWRELTIGRSLPPEIFGS